MNQGGSGAIRGARDARAGVSGASAQFGGDGAGGGAGCGGEMRPPGEVQKPP